jgi:CheY-like chemotaxis protein
MYQSIMVIDDNPLERVLAEAIVKNSKFAERVIAYESAVSALAYLRSLGEDPSKFPDVILVDIQMPVMTGFEFLDKFMEFPPEIQQRCKIIMFSSSVEEEDHEKVKKYPIIRKFLPKPLLEKMFYDLEL